MRRGRKSEAQTPSPKKDQIKGSKVNPKGSASSTKSAKSIELSESIITTLENKRDEYNKKHPNGKVTLGALKAVFRRGAGAFSSSHRPNMTRSGWAFARVNKFLLKKGGTKVKAAYVQDDDLMERGAILDSSCKTYISKNESILKTGYYLNLNEFSSMIDPYGQIPLNLNYTLVTYNSGNQDRLSLIDTINPINLQNELADILNIPLNNAQVVVGLYIEMGKKLKSISQIGGDNILVIDRDKLVCKSGKDDDLMEKGGLIAPNGNKSNLTLEQYKLVRTPEFKAWFGDWENDPENASKVVDENGEPLVVYHGTNSEFYYFDKNSESNTHGTSQGFQGFFFTKSKGRSGDYALSKEELKGGDATVISAFLSLKNPNIKDAKNQSWVNVYPEQIDDSFDNKNDGVIAYNILDGATSYSYWNNNPDDNYIAFHPEQIKLADDSNTTFDGENPDIRYEDGGDLGQEITCVNCGWSWNTNQSDASDKYVCHKCHFDNRTFYDSDPIGKYHLGGDMSKHLAPNGKPSNLTHEQWHLVRTPEFKAWFGDWENDPENASKVVDGNGEPMVVYRGMPKKRKFGNIFNYNVNLFKENRKKNKFAFYFSRTKEEAERYGFQFVEYNDDDYIIKEYFLKINKLFIAVKKDSVASKSKININSSRPNRFTLYEKPIPEIDKELGKGYLTFKELFDLAKPNKKDFELLNNEYTNNKDAKKEYEKEQIRVNAKPIYSYFIDILTNDKKQDFWRNYLKDIKKYDGLMFYEDTHALTFIGKGKNEKAILEFLDNPNTICVFEPNQIKLADGSNTTFDAENPDIRYEEGGELKKPHTIIEIAEKHKIKVSEVVKALIKGQKQEREHTKDDKIAKIIAKHHLWESPLYYEKLKEMEETFEDGGNFVLDEIALPDTYSNIETLKRVLANQGYEIVKSVKNQGIFETGGMVVGKSHQEADENGTGEKFKLKSTGQIVELEGGEAVIVGKAIDSEDKISFDGQDRTPREIASYLNHAYGGVKFEKGGHITCGCSHKKYYHGGELPSAVVNSLHGGEAVITKKTMESKDRYEYEGEKLTPRQILSRINHRYGGVSFAKGGKLTKFTNNPINIASKMIYFVNNMIYE
jgi:hypothetical protein